MSSKVIFVSQAANLYGSERTLVTLLEGDFPKGLSPVAVFPGGGPLGKVLDHLGVEQVPWEFNKARFLQNPCWHWNFFASFRRLLRNVRPLAVVLVFEGNVPLLVAACRSLGIPVMRILQREIRPASSFRQWLARLPDKLAFQFCQGVFCGARVLDRQLKENYGLKARPPTALVRLPVRTTAPKFDDSAAWRETYGIPPNALLVGQFSRLHPGKGIDILLRAARKVLDRHPMVYFIVCGGHDGSPGGQKYGSEMQALVETWGISKNCFFSGRIEDVFTAMRACDIIALGSRAEGVGIAILEAWLSGRPVVGSDVDGLGEIIQESQGGLVFPVGNDEALAEQIDVLAKGGKAMRHEMAEKGRKWTLENCSPEVFRMNFWNAFTRFIQAVPNDKTIGSGPG
jgi:glycosyltransferase involved in cell wall biosynthesis